MSYAIYLIMGGDTRFYC